MSRLRIRNWEKYQHYKDRNPPWIKLHNDTLTSEDWVMWDDASRVLAVACMLIASRSDEEHRGTLRADPAFIKRVAYLNEEPDFGPLISSGFLILEGDASTMLAPHKQMLQNAEPETETETETDNRDTNVSLVGTEASSDEGVADRRKKLFEAWARFADENDLPKMRKATKSRKGHANARLKEWTDEEIQTAMDAVLENPWNLGENDRGWRANIDWFLRPDTIPKLLERAESSEAQENPWEKQQREREERWRKRGKLGDGVVRVQGLFGDVE